MPVFKSWYRGVAMNVGSTAVASAGVVGRMLRVLYRVWSDAGGAASRPLRSGIHILTLLNSHKGPLKLRVARTFGSFLSETMVPWAILCLPIPGWVSPAGRPPMAVDQA